MKRYETMTTKEIMDAFNSPSICKDNSCADCFIYKERLKGNIKENICGAGAGTCSTIIRNYLSEDLSNDVEEKWHYTKKDDYPMPGSEVIIGYCDDSGDYEHYYSTIGKYDTIFGYPFWIVDNEKFIHDVEAWMYLPEYNGKKK